MKMLTGQVVSTKTAKTATVLVERRWRHPLYKKIVKRSKRYLAHDELGVAVGDQVRMTQSRPLSRRKHWKIVELVASENQKKRGRR